VDWRSLRPRVNSRSEIRRKTGPRVDSKTRGKSLLRGIFDLESKTQSLNLEVLQYVQSRDKGQCTMPCLRELACKRDMTAMRL
jgi:hypothetical protein